MATTQITAEPAVPQLIVISEYAAPRDLLFRAYTDPDLLAQWLRPCGLTVTIDHIDPRHGGTWRYTGSDADGSKYVFHGMFHGTPSPDGIVQTLEFDGMPGHVCLETVTFTERRQTTLVTQNTVYQSSQDRDRVLYYDMGEDINESIERLEQLLAWLSPVSPSGMAVGVPLQLGPAHWRDSREHQPDASGNPLEPDWQAQVDGADDHESVGKRDEGELDIVEVLGLPARVLAAQPSVGAARPPGHIQSQPRSGR